MKVKVRYFARLREAAGCEEEDVEMTGTDRTLDALLQSLAAESVKLQEFFSSRPVLCAVNREYAGGEKTLREGDEVALFPPVSGG